MTCNSYRYQTLSKFWIYWVMSSWVRNGRLQKFCTRAQERLRSAVLQQTDIFTLNGKKLSDNSDYKCIPRKIALTRDTNRNHKQRRTSSLRQGPRLQSLSLASIIMMMTFSGCGRHVRTAITLSKHKHFKNNQFTDKT